MDTRVFTREEADRLVPQIRFLFGQITLAQSKATRAVEALGGVRAAERALKADRVNPGLESSLAELKEATAEIVKCVEAINEMGCLVKSLDSGLVDFPYELDGRIVYLCWQYGEVGITHWHEVDGGFEGRQPLDAQPQPQLLH
jgi:hypothetical protein